MRATTLVLLLAVSALAEDQFYQFAVEQDRLGEAADFSFLNRPLTPADRLIVRSGHFYRVGRDLKPNTADDQRVRLFGANLCFGANFPEEADAARIARRLRKLGINLVRLHHMDSSPDRDPKEARSLLTTGPYPTLNPVSIPIQSKPLHIFQPRMVHLQTEYARQVIEALRLKGDPVLGMVELDNESSLVEAHQRGNLERAAQGEYKAELERQWQAYWPDRQAAEIDPALAAFGAFQDGDSIIHFAYEHARSWDTRVPNGFNINGDWTKFPNIGQSAWLFRSGAVRAGKQPITLPGADPPRRQQLMLYAGTQDWWTVEPEPGSGRPSGSRAGGSPPVWMERVECFVTLRSRLNRLAVYPLDGAGARLKPLADAVTRSKESFRIHLQADGQELAPWYELARP